MGEVAREFTARVFHPPPVMTQRNDFVALRYELAGFELDDLLIPCDRGEEFSDTIAAVALT